MTTVKNTELLDLALADRPADTKAKVLELVLKLGVSPEDEFWLILVALKSLELLILEAPETWEATFQTFARSLTTWSDQNLNLLEREAKITATHSRLTQHQTQLLSQLVTILMQQNATWQTAVQTSNSWQTKFKRLMCKQGESLQHIEHGLTSLTAQVNTAMPRPSSWKDKTLKAFDTLCRILVGLWLLGLVSSGLNRQAVEETSAAHQWLRGTQVLSAERLGMGL
jgi:hypothetical protein